MCVCVWLFTPVPGSADVKCGGRGPGAAWGGAHADPPAGPRLGPQGSGPKKMHPWED